MKIEAGTIARTIVLVIALANQVCVIMGWTPLDVSEDAVYQLCSLAATVGASLWGFWKNNSFTRAAIAADLVLRKNKEV